MAKRNNNNKNNKSIVSRGSAAGSTSLASVTTESSENTTSELNVEPNLHQQHEQESLLSTRSAISVTPSSSVTEATKESLSRPTSDEILVLDDDFFGSEESADINAAINDINAAKNADEPNCPPGSAIDQYLSSIRSTLHCPYCESKIELLLDYAFSVPKSFSGFNKNFFRQPPLRIQADFPALLTHKSGVSRDLGNLLQSCIQNGAGPKRFLGNRQKQQMSIMTALKSPTVYPEFSKFKDKTQYSGYIPSTKYLRGIYTAMIDIYRPFIDTLVMMLGREILKGDHSFKIIKNMGTINGQPTFTAMYTVVNEFGEIRLLQLVPTKSLNHLAPQFDAMMKSYGYYDFEQATTINNDSNTINTNLPTMTIPESTTYFYIKDATIINRHCDSLIRKSMDEIIVIGLDAQWNFDKTTKIKGKISVLQLAYEDIVYVFHLNNKNSTLPTGKMVNGDPSKITRDFISSFTRNGEEQEYCQGGLELGSFCRDHGGILDGRTRLSRMCEIILGHKLPKEDAVRLSNWNTTTLSTSQIKYATLDALVSLQIYKAIGPDLDCVSNGFGSDSDRNSTIRIVNGLRSMDPSDFSDMSL
ncbi:hypothetical protein INT45_007261 [Circinella minor]|uniref:3'-5' exonuclease domain-containing protein n=1 Tax=Circinella minor TaxID=1195481 RepID=A0A8H7S7V8_9FUNG|nr:hypothetical protein INT45_007261 [Circinella minor]